MNFCIVESKTKKKPIPNKYLEVENVNPKSIANFKNFVAKSELISQLDNNPITITTILYRLLLKKPKMCISQRKLKNLMYVNISEIPG